MNHPQPRANGQRMPPRAAGLALAAALLTTGCSSGRLAALIPGGDDATPEAQRQANAALTTDQRREQRIAEAKIADGATIKKIKTYHLNSYRTIQSTDPSIPFEQHRLLHGAVSRTQQIARFGHYYHVAWSLDDRSSPVEVAFTYRQQKTGPEVHSLTIPVPEPRRHNTTRFQVTGAPYWENGPVTSWRLSIRQNGETIAADQSFLWD